MTREELFEAVNGVSDADLDHSERKRSQPPWVGAAALACAAALALALLPKGGTASPDPSLPLLPDLGPAVEGAGSSYALMAYDLSELCADSPGVDMTLPETLPVWKNSACSASGAPWGLGEEEVSARLDSAAQALGVTLLHVEEERAEAQGDPQVPAGTLLRLKARTDGGVTITSCGNGTIEIYYDDPVELPAEYSFTWSGTTSAQARETLDHLAGEYAGLLGFEKPRAHVFADCFFDGTPNIHYGLYDAAGGEGEALVNCYLRSASFSPNYEGKLWIIRIRDLTLVGEKLGDYPLRSEKEARKALLRGDYQSAETAPFPGKEAVRGVELVYSSEVNDPVWIPYYRFWVEIPPLTEGLPEGLRTYASYYVPAVRPEYLTEGDAQMGGTN